MPRAAIERRRIDVGAEDICLDIYHGDGDGAGVSAIAMHGAGASDKARCAGLCAALAEYGLSSAAIDFSGYGDSSSRTPPCVSKRTAEAAGVIGQVVGNNVDAISIFAFSMSGQAAIDLLQTYGGRIRNLVLFSPGLYSAACVDIPFGPAFSACIRVADNWLNSTAGGLLRKFRGNLVLVTPAFDPVIPRGVTELIVSSASGCRLKTIVLADAPHTLGSWMTDNPLRTRAVVAEIVAFCGLGKLPPAGAAGGV